MSNYFDEQMLSGFRDELRKIAIAVPWQAMKQGLTGVGQAIKGGAGAVGTGAGMGGIAGGAIGAGIGGYSKYHQAKEQGAGTGEAIGSAIGGAAKGGVIGLGTGAVAGGVGAGVLHGAGKLTPEMLERARSVPGLGAGARYGQTQAHVATGWTPKSGLGGLGVGSENARNQLTAAAQRSYGLETAKNTGGFVPEQQSVWGKLRRGVLGDARDTRWRANTAGADTNRLVKAVSTGEEAERRGMTNVPGYLKSLKEDPTGTLGTALKQRWHEQGNVGKAMMVGLPLGLGAYDIARDDPERSRGARAVSAAGNTLGSFAFAPMSMTGDMVMGTALSGGAMKAGKGLDKIFGKKPVVHGELGRSPGLDVEEHNLGGPVERIETSRFKGEAPEGGVA